MLLDCIIWTWEKFVLFGHAPKSQFQIASIFCRCTFLCSAFHQVPVHRCQFVIINKCTETEVIDYLWKIDILAAKRNANKLKMVFFISLVDDLFDVWWVFRLFYFLSSIPSPFSITIGISIDLNVYFSCFPMDVPLCKLFYCWTNSVQSALQISFSHWKWQCNKTIRSKNISIVLIHLEKFPFFSILSW